MNLRVALVLSVMTLAVVAALFPAWPDETMQVAASQGLRGGRGLRTVSVGWRPDRDVFQLATKAGGLSSPYGCAGGAPGQVIGCQSASAESAGLLSTRSAIE